MTNGKLIVITGPAAAGKSTVAKAVQAALVQRGELCLMVELDVFGRGLPRDWIGVGDRRGRHAERGFVYARAEDGSIGLALGPDGRRVLAAFHRSVAAIVRSGISVVCETIVYDDDDWSDWSEALHGIAARWVKLNAPLGVLQDREKADRSRVFQGLAQGMSARRPVGTYDVEADTAAEAAETIAARVIRSLPA